MQQEADIELFRVLGFNELMTTFLGLVQFAGGLLMIFSKFRKWGGLTMMATFLIASMAVFMNQLWLFGIVSLLFIAMAYIVVRYENLIKK